MKNKNKVIIIISVILTLGILLMYYVWPSIHATILVNKLWLYRKDENTARKIAERLALTKEGVSASVKDISTYGGRTRGWSAYVILHTKHSEYAKNKLIELVRKDISPSKTIEAYILLWEITGDKSYLIDLYDSVKVPYTSESPLPGEKAYGRDYLVRLFASSDEAKNIFSKHVDQSLDLTTEEFKKFLESNLKVGK